MRADQESVDARQRGQLLEHLQRRAALDVEQQHHALVLLAAEARRLRARHPRHNLVQHIVVVPCQQLWLAAKRLDLIQHHL